MLSREADALFWIGRYLERADATARVVDVQYHAALESRSAQYEPETLLYRLVAKVYGDAERFQARHGGSRSERDLVHFLVFDMERPGAVASCVQAVRRNAREVRSVLPSEMWETINRMFLELRDWDVDRVLDDGPHAFLSDIRDRCHLFFGLVERTMLVGEATHFLKLGIFLERANQMSRFVDVLLHDLPRGGGTEEGDAGDPHDWIACLKSAAAFEAFHQTGREAMNRRNVLSFLLLDERFPSSVFYAVSEVQRCLRALAGTEGRRYASDAERLVGLLRADLACTTGTKLDTADTQAVLRDVQKRCFKIGEAIHRLYLT